MKRHPALRDLSSEHHQGLVLAKHIRQALAGERTPGPDWAEVKAVFEASLEPHFRKEEADLLPALEAAGEGELVARTRAEHEAMRRLVREGGPADLARFAQLLTDHIRFEERVLFQVAQERLPGFGGSSEDRPPGGGGAS